MREEKRATDLEKLFYMRKFWPLHIELTSMTSHCGLSHCSQKVGRHRWHGLNVSVLSKQAKYKGACGFKTSCTPATVSWNIGCTFFFSEKCDLHHPGSNWEPLSGLQSSENGKLILIAKCSFITQDTRMEMYREMMMMTTTTSYSSFTHLVKANMKRNLIPWNERMNCPAAGSKEQIQRKCH